jgi:hypothetical protein
VVFAIAISVLNTKKFGGLFMATLTQSTISRDGFYASPALSAQCQESTPLFIVFLPLFSVFLAALPAFSYASFPERWLSIVWR